MMYLICGYCVVNRLFFEIGLPLILVIKYPCCYTYVIGVVALSFQIVSAVAVIAKNRRAM